MRRHFPSPAEQRASLEAYIEQLKAELAGAESALARLTTAD